MISYTGGSGESIEDAIVIAGARQHFEAIAAEYEYLRKRFAESGTEYKILLQELVEDGDRRYDRITVGFPDGSTAKTYFDITESFREFHETLRKLIEGQGKT